jgi:hypothetical protein
MTEGAGPATAHDADHDDAKKIERRAPVTAGAGVDYLPFPSVPTGSYLTNVARFVDPRLPADDLEELALSINHTQGNRHFSDMVDTVREPRAAVQRSMLIQRSPAKRKRVKGGTPPDVGARVSTQYPNLQLGDKLGELEKIFKARYEIDLLNKELDKPGSDPQFPLRTSPLSDDTPARDEVLQEIETNMQAAKALSISIPTDKVLGNDILSQDKSSRGKEAAFRDAMYKLLISHPMQLYIGEGLEPKPLFTYKWGPNSWVLGNAGGKVKWEHLMQVQKWNVDYQKVLTGDMVEILQEMDDLKKGMRGSPLGLDGKKLGETYGHFWNSTIKVRTEPGNISGYGPDGDEQKELNADWAKVKGARLKVKAPDGYVHIYTLDSFNTYDMKEPGVDGYVYLLDKGTQVSGVMEVWTTDGTQLEACSAEDGKGWRTKKEINEAEQFAMGAILGDIMDDPSATMTVGQIVMGCIPIVGQVADARDVAAGIYKMYKTGGKDGKLQTAFALIGFIPLIGDGVKSAWKAARGAGKEAAEKAAKKAFIEGAQGGEHALAERLLKNSDEVAKAFNLTKQEAHAFANSLRELGEKAAKNGGADAVKYVDALRQTLSDLGGNGGSLVAMLGGKWSKVANELKALPGGEAIGKDLQQWRVAQFDSLEKKVAGQVAAAPEGAAARRLEPKMERTGTPSFASDVDVSFLGPSATADRNAAMRAMEEQFGTGWRDLLDADIFADPKRLHMFEDPLAAIGKSGPAGAKAAKEAEKRVVKEAELNVLAKMLKDGADPAVVNKMAKDMGVNMAELAARQKEITNLSKDYLTGMLKKGTPEAEVRKMAGEMGVSMDDVLKNMDHFEDAYAKLELKMDVLHQDYINAAGNLPKQAQIAEEMAAVQGKLNAAIPGPYMTPGGGAKHVSRREPKLRGTAGYKAMSPAMGYMAVLDDLYMLQHSLPAAGKPFTEKSAKSMAKYGDRLLVTGGQFGVDMGGKATGPMFQNVAELLAAARRDPKALAKCTEELGAAKGALNEQLDGVLKGVKQNADDYLADVASGAAAGGDVVGNVAKSEKDVLAQKALVNAIKEPTKDELDRQAKQEEADKANAAITP